MKIGWLACNPAEEAKHRFPFVQRLRPAVKGQARQFCIGEMRVDRPVANGMHRHFFSPSPAFRYRVMPFDSAPQ